MPRPHDIDGRTVPPADAAPTIDWDRADPPALTRRTFSCDLRSAGEARTYVAEVFETLQLGTWVDVAKLLVSELVTNVVLHAHCPAEVVVRAGTGWVRVDVHDDSPTLPGRRHYTPDSMTGRGLAILDELAAAWGVTADTTGKSVFFELGDPPDRRLDPTPSPRPGFDVALLALPPDLVAATLQHGDALMREVELLVLANELDAETSHWTAPSLDLGPVLDAAAEGSERGLDRLDIVVAMPPGSAEAALGRLSVLEEVEHLAGADLLLSPASLPEMLACRRWLLREITLQASGSPPTPWVLPEPALPLHDPVSEELRPVDLEAIAGLGPSVVAVNADNRIVFADLEAATLLGWAPDELVGRRLLEIVPPPLRQAHLAGFARFRLTTESHIVDRPIRLPALRRDRSTTMVSLTITVLRRHPGLMLAATLSPVD
jgi:PAS domain S-box-containing protein